MYATIHLAHVWHWLNIKYKYIHIPIVLGGIFWNSTFSFEVSVTSLKLNTIYFKGVRG
jgi:hypothetical protein